jgi:hypothetical protein
MATLENAVRIPVVMMYVRCDLNCWTSLRLFRAVMVQ